LLWKAASKLAGRKRQQAAALKSFGSVMGGNMRDSDRQSEFRAARFPLRGRQGDKPRSLQANWWARACAAFAVCVAAAITSSAQTFRTLHSFDLTDGANPLGGLVQAADGNFYGTTAVGGANDNCLNGTLPGCGTIFKVTREGKLTTLYSFCPKSGCADGSEPIAALLQASNGNFYGTTFLGGANGSNEGSIFKVTPNATPTTLYSFDGSDGGGPFAPLIQATDGNLYGTTQGGSDSTCYGGCGTVFKITPGGALASLYTFCSGGCADGAQPEGGLVQAANGNFYGTTLAGGDGGACEEGGEGGCGTVFTITAAGGLTTLYSFCSQSNCADGANPGGTLIQATDGNFYGTTPKGGASGWGTVFKITPSGALTTLHSFDLTDGAYPWAAGLAQGSDGNFYGTTVYGGAYLHGTVFKITPGGTLTTLHNFCAQSNCTDGATPYAGLIQATDGSFYGTTELGGLGTCFDGCGTVFGLSVGLGPFVKTLPSSGTVGSPVRILGNYLANTTSVTFNGTPATFTVISPSLITTTVPAGATTGTVQVVTPGGTLSSNVPFRVIQ
jgi:uncharacterized repeat protein (TIGR03803 family)